MPESRATTLLRSLGPPDLNDPTATLRWVRRWEVLTGIACILFGLAFWSQGWWHWFLIAIGLSGVSPWPGIAQTLRRAERNPDLLVTDPERRRDRGRRTTFVLIPTFTLAGAITGYLTDGWPAAAFMGGLIGLSAILGGVLYEHLARR